jgi:DNA-binding XRE family transcriptional regulator
MNMQTTRYNGLSSAGDLMEMPGDASVPLTMEEVIELARINHAAHQAQPAPGCPHCGAAVHTVTMAERLKERRLAVGLTQDELAEKCAVTKGSISAWESGKTDNIGLQSFLKLLAALETDFHYLVFGRGAAPQSRRQPQPARQRAPKINP